MLDQFIYMKKCGLPLAEIANELGCDYNAVKSKSAVLTKKGIVPGYKKGFAKGSKIMENDVKAENNTAVGETTESVSETTESVSETAESVSETAESVGETTDWIDETNVTKNVNHTKLYEMIDKGLVAVDSAGIDVISFKVILHNRHESNESFLNYDRSVMIAGTDRDGYAIDIEIKK